MQFVREILVVIVVVAAVSFAEEAATGQLDCEAQLLSSDAAVNKILMLVDKNATGYKTIQQFDSEYCIPFNEWIKEARKYRPCLKAFPTQIYSIVMSNVKKTWKKFCLPGPNKNTGFRHLKCMRPSNKGDFIKVGNIIVSFMDYVSKVEDLDEAIPSLCCGSKSLLLKAEDQLEKTCSSVRQKGSGKWMANITYSLLQDALDMMCGSYDTLEVCNSKVPQLMTKIDASLDPEANFNYTMIVPLVRLVKRLDGQLNLQ